MSAPPIEKGEQVAAGDYISLTPQQILDGIQAVISHANTMLNAHPQIDAGNDYYPDAAVAQARGLAMQPPHPMPARTMLAGSEYLG